MKRREFLKTSAMAAGGLSLLPRNARAMLQSAKAAAGQRSAAAAPQSSISFETTDAVYQRRYQAALDVLAHNVQTMPGYAEPVLIEGSVYRGVWQECGPQEGLVYASIRPDIARNNHMAFFANQREDGQLPCDVKQTEIGHGQIQMVVPIAATAWELAQETGDSHLLEAAYRSCSRWDAWLRRYRDTRHTGLCEGFCTYDTGMDHSPRWAGLPNRCPDADARKCPPDPQLPRLCPDLSATVYGGRMALAAMARALNKDAEADRWLHDAEAIRSLIVERLYDSADAAFYDLDAHNRFVRILSVVNTRVLGEHVADRKLFETLYEKQILNPKAFWAPYPFPSAALDEPTFVRPIPRNSWGGAAQALTALRAPRWMEHYGKPADLAHLMQQWVSALIRSDGFTQQMDPLSGEFVGGDPSGYSPAALVLLDFTWRLSGVRKAQGDIEWNLRPPAGTVVSTFRLRVSPAIRAELRYASGQSELLLNGRRIARVSGAVRLITTRDGELRTAAGIAPEKSSVTIQRDGRHEHKFAIEPNSIHQFA
jgi:hypothetical protein